jgi:lon-related putative ATP-dependent protease
VATTRELGPAALRRVYDPDTLGFETTGELEDQLEAVGQPRAVAAIEFAAGIGRAEYNVFAHGASGTGKHSLVENHLRKHAAVRPTPPDVCYVHNFERSDEPNIIILPPGIGTAFRKDMGRLTGGLGSALRGAFESEEYLNRRQVIEDVFKERPRQELQEVEARANKQELVLLRSPSGIAFAPTRDGEVLSSEDFLKLTPEEQQSIQETVESFQTEVQKALREMPSWDRERQEKVRDLERELIGLAIGDELGTVRRRYEKFAELAAYLDAVREDVIENGKDLVEADIPQQDGASVQNPAQPTQISLRRYHVNLVVDNSKTSGAPVIYEDNPTYDNLVGRIEQSAQFGGMFTDFTHIKAGSLFYANGGYLMVDAHRLLQTPHAWETLKRALHSRRLEIESSSQAMNLMSAMSLAPKPLDLDVQVVLLGDPMLYYTLSEQDRDFDELFKVAADFAERMDATDENCRGYVRLLAMLARQDDLKPFDKTAIARLLEHSARLAGEQDMLTALIGQIHDILREADYWAGHAGCSIVSQSHVQQAIDAKINRADRIRDRTYQEIERGTIMIDVEGREIGQINGLAVISWGNFAFGRPNRLTARVRIGQGDVVDIEREVELGGPLHSKGVLILAAYLGANYASDSPLSLSASLVFEQSYSGVDGDSASAAESFALLSAIAQVPLRQNLAVTGSVNQLGVIQPIGGVNEKIEGFFDVCRAKGLTGDQGVIIPASNVRHLMLRQDVVDAASQGKFHIYPIETIDQGIELLTGQATSKRDESGVYAEGTFNRIVADRLVEMAEKRRSFDSPGGPVPTPPSPEAV